MEPLLNRLLDEATSRATELTALATEAVAVVDALAARAQEWERALGRHGGETLQRFRELQARCDGASGDLAESGAGAEEALDGLDERARLAGERVRRLTASARDALARLAAAAGRQSAEAGQATDDACLALDARHAAALDLQADVEARLHQAEAEVAAFREAVSEAQVRFEDAIEGLESAVDRMCDEGRDQTRSTVVAVDLLLAHIAARQEQLAVGFHDASEPTLAAIDQAYGEDLPLRLSEAYRPFEETTSDICRLADRVVVDLEAAVADASSAGTVEQGTLVVPTGALALAAGLAG